MAALLIVDDVAEYLRSLTQALKSELEVVTATSLAEAKSTMGDRITVALVDIRLSEEDDTNRDGLVFLEWMKMNHPRVPVLIMSAYRDFDVAVDALNLGAAFFLRKPINLRELKGLLKTLAADGSLSKQTEELRMQLQSEDRAE